MASVKCSKCGSLIGNVIAGSVIKCPKCGNAMRLTTPGTVGMSVAQHQESGVQAAVTGQPVLKNKKTSTGIKIIGILLIILGVSGFLMGLMMFGDIGIACIVGALSAFLSGIGFLKID